MYEASVRCTNTTVLIVGAGPTGLTLACDLRRRGVALRIVDAAPEPFAGSRGKGLQPRTLEIFDDLGVVDAIRAAGATYPRFRMHAGPFSLRAGTIGTNHAASEATPYPNMWMVPQWRTEEILRARLAQLGGAVEQGTTLTALRQDDDGVAVTLADGETLRAEYVVGCDGGHSFVRKTLGERFSGEALPSKPQLVGDVEVEGLDRRDWHVWPLAKGGVLSLCPLPGTRQFQLAAPAAAEHRIERTVYETTGYDVARVSWSSVYRPQVRMVERYRVGRVFLAGDAAHVHPPQGGQGLNTGVQDAYNLGWKLAAVLRGATATLLDSYEAERLPIAAAVLGLTKQLHQSRSIRRGDATNQLALHYRGSALSTGAPLGKLQPGDRMPDARLPDGTRLFDRLRGPHATLLVTKAGARVLIRPDGYIASIGRDDIADYYGEAPRVVHAA